jgi:hypothetical protein
MEETVAPAQPALVKAEALQRALVAGSAAAAYELIALVAAHTDDAPLYCDLLVKIPEQALLPALLEDTEQAVEVVRAMASLLGTHRPPERGEVDAAIMWLIGIAQEAAAAAELDLLEESCNGAFEWDAAWDQWAVQRDARASPSVQPSVPRTRPS